jgi:hypothetical protein
VGIPLCLSALCLKTNTDLDELYDQALVTIKALQQQQSSKYVRLSLDALNVMPRRYHRCFERSDGLYARITSMIQSSGTGEPRQVSESVRSVVGITCALRETGSLGYRPGDPNVDQLLKADLSHCRLLRLFKMLSIWTFLPNTSSGLAILVPEAEDDGSSRVVPGNSQRVDPFFSLSIDLEIHRRLQDPKLGEKERHKSRSHFGTLIFFILFESRDSAMHPQGICGLGKT